MADEITRSAAKLALAIAVPVAVLAGLGAFLLLDRAGADPGAGPDTAATDPPVPDPTATGPVTTAARELTQWETTVCRAVVSQLPDELDGMPQRPVTDGPEQNAAFGAPPITLSCGVAPVDYELTAQVYPGSGVCWHATEHDDGTTVWATLDREVPVQVTVPAGYDAPYQHVLEFSPVLIETVRSGESAPSGCAG